MSLTDSIKSLHTRATDLVCPARIVFHHVPKCGGTSVGRVIRRAYILSQATVTPAESEHAFDLARARHRALADPHVSHFREMMLLYHLASDRRCIAAHVPFSDIAFERYGTRYAFLTVLREPLARFVSHFAWSSREVAAFPIREPLEQFLETPRARQLGATYLRYFCGKPGGDMAGWSIDDAIANLRRMHGVGFLDDIAGVRDMLFDATGHRFRIGRENVAAAPDRRDAVLEGPLRRKIVEACAPDLEIWNAVQDLRTPVARRSASTAEVALA